MAFTHLAYAGRMVPHKGEKNFTNRTVHIEEVRRPWSTPNFGVFIELRARAFHCGD